MGIPDYKKIMVNIKKWDSDSKTVEKRKEKSVGDAVGLLEKGEKFLRDEYVMWKLSYQQLYVINKSWYKVADKLIVKQEELKKAEKAKDKGKSATLKKEVEKMHKDASKLEASFEMVHTELTKLDLRFRDIIRAAEALPK